MCGLAGLILPTASRSKRERLAEDLRLALRHRGPDGSGIWSSPESAVTLVHTRLAILDPSTASAQPLGRGPLHLVFNGEIYNHRAVRAGLEAEGTHFSSTGDTEVLLHLCARHGSAGLARLRGMFAFALWDERDRSCLLARDTFGLKPLYYARLPDHGLVFASELRALLATGLISREIDPVALDDFLARGSITEPRTLLKDVSCLEAGRILTWKDGCLYEAELPKNLSTTVENGEGLTPALLDSIRHHLISDVPVGILLSGGLDSGALLAAARRTGGPAISTFSLSVEDSALDEGPAARRVAKHLGARHHELLLTRELALRWMPEFLAAVDQPTVDGFNTWCACQLAADHGCKVLLSGIGSDELLGGYPTFRQVPRLRALGRVLAPARCLIPSLPSPRGRRITDFLRDESTYSRAYGAVRSLFSRRERQALSEALIGGWSPGPDHPDPPDWNHRPAAEAVSHLEFHYYLRNQLLRDADVFSMAHGVELRLPFVDLPFVQAVQAMAPTRRYAPHKQALREAVPELTPDLIPHRKRGFSLPFNRWLADEEAGLTSLLPTVPDVPLLPASRSWALIVLRSWMKRHGVA